MKVVQFVIICAVCALSSAAQAMAETYSFPSRHAAPVNLRIEGSGDIEAIGPLISDFQSLHPQSPISTR